ncbi:MAG: hypothetical protein BGO01_14385 [Armatimonadetes bacterium 55-13]|nr:MAG: hypothetical protein BGO01_14385 [Armatimonadetes bacterium 55-13]
MFYERLEFGREVFGQSGIRRSTFTEQGRSLNTKPNAPPQGPWTCFRVTGDIQSLQQALQEAEVTILERPVVKWAPGGLSIPSL